MLPFSPPAESQSRRAELGGSTKSAAWLPAEVLADAKVVLARCKKMSARVGPAPLFGALLATWP